MSVPEAEIDYGQFLPIDGDPPLDDDAPYDTYQVESSYNFDTGTVQLPGTGTGETPGIAAFVQVHGGLMTLEVTWVAGRTGEAPVLPAFASPDPNWVALRGVVTAQHLEMSADGSTPVYMVAGHYVYGAVDPSQANVTAPIPPFFADLAASQIGNLAAASYTNSILWQFQGQSGCNPLAGVVPIDQSPDDSWSTQEDQVLDLTIDNIPEEFDSVPPGGLGSVGGGSGGSGQLPSQQVNP